VNARDDKVLSFIQKCEHLFPGYGWKALQKGFDRLARLNLFDESLHRDTRTGKYWSSAEYLRRDSDDPGSHRIYPMPKTNPVTTFECYNRIGAVSDLAYCFAPAFLM